MARFDEVYQQFDDRIESLIEEISCACNGDILAEVGVYELIIDRLEVASDAVISLRD